MIAPIGANIRALTLVIALAFLATSVGVSYWTLVASADLNGDAFNPRLLATLLDRPRGKILAADGTELARSERLPDGTYRRRYADRSLAHVVGYASFKYGASGLEGAYGESLVGRDAADPIGQWRSRYLKEHSEPASVRTAIVPAVQAAAAQALGGRRGAVIALDPRTGAILASVSNPNYDPNLIVDPAQQDIAWQQVNGNRERPLIDRATSGLYPPGSAFKVVTAAAALEGGVVTPDQKIRVDDPYQADPSWGSYHVRSVTQAHGEFDLSLAMQRSENIYFAKLGLTAGAPRLTEYASRFGIGAAPRCELPTAKGQIARGSIDRPTLLADTSFGQGELLVSPLQMALVAATIARGGSLPTPHYATAVLDARGDPLRIVEPGAAGQVIRPDTAATIGAAMVAAVMAPGAFAFGAAIPGVNVAGKTGTAEVPSGAPHGWFIGFAPAQAATAVVAVLIENSPKGGEDAAPVGGAVLRAAVGR